MGIGVGEGGGVDSGKRVWLRETTRGGGDWGLSIGIVYLLYSIVIFKSTWDMYLWH